jgi:hypothetical protein
MYAVEAWTIVNGSSPCLDSSPSLARSAEFADRSYALQWIWDRLEEGFAVRMHRR